MQPDFNRQKFVFNARDQKLGFPAEAPFTDALSMLDRVDLLKPRVLQREYDAKNKKLSEGHMLERVQEGVTYEHIALTGIEGQLTEHLYGKPFSRGE